MNRGAIRRSRAVVAVGIAAVAVLSSVLLAGTAVSAAGSTPGGITAAFTPSELTMTAGESRTVVLLLDNASNASIVARAAVPSSGADHKKSAFAAVRVSIRDKSQTIQAGGSVTVPVTVTVTGQLSSAVTVDTTISYSSAGIPQSTVATLTVSPGPFATAPPSAIVIRASGDQAMADTQAADLYFTLQNISSRTQEVTGATLTFPSFLQVELSGGPTSRDSSPGVLKLPITDRREKGQSASDRGKIAAGDGRTLHFRISAPHGVQPGNSLIVLSLTYTDPDGGTTGFVTGSQPLALTVFGESAVTGAFGAALAPALFVVPGLLFVLVVWFLWRRVYPIKLGIDISPPSALTGVTVLAVLGVLFALPFPALYTLIFHRDYRAVYGFNDIAYMCALAIVTGVVVWAIVVAVRALIRRFRIEIDDPAPTVFRKLTRTGRRLDSVENAQYTAAAGVDTVFVLRYDATTALVCPAIVTLPSGNSVDYVSRFDELLTAQSDRFSSNRKLYDLVDAEGIAVHPQYSAAKNFAAVSRVPVSALKNFGRGRIINVPPPEG